MFKNRDALLASLYGFTGQPDFYEKAAETIRNDSNSDVCGLWQVSSEGEMLDGSYTTGYTDADYKEYWEDFSSLNHVIGAVAPRLMNGDCVRKSDVLSMKVHKETAYFCEFERPRDLLWEVGCAVTKGLNAITVLSIGRGEHNRDFSEKEAAETDAFGSMLGQIAQKHEQILSLQEGTNRNRAILSRKGQVLSANGPLVLELLEPGSHLSKLKQWIVAKSFEDKTNLDLVLPPGAKRLLRHQGNQYQIRLRPLLETEAKEDAAAFELLLELNQPKLVAAKEWLKRHHHLTSRELEMTIWLSRGGSVQEFSEHNRISAHTARSHLKKAQRKTNSRSQVALVQWLSAQFKSLGFDPDGDYS